MLDVIELHIVDLQHSDLLMSLCFDVLDCCILWSNNEEDGVLPQGTMILVLRGHSWMTLRPPIGSIAMRRCWDRPLSLLILRRVRSTQLSDPPSNYR